MSTDFRACQVECRIECLTGDSEANRPNSLDIVESTAIEVRWSQILPQDIDHYV